MPLIEREIIDWNITKYGGNPVIDVSDNPAEVHEQYVPGPIQLPNGDVWVYCKGSYNIYGWKSTDGGETFTLQNGGAPVVPQGGAGAWDSDAAVEPTAIYDSATDIIHLWYGGAAAGISAWGWGHATAPGSDPTNFTKDASNPIFSNADAVTALGGAAVNDFKVSDIVVIDGVFYFYGHAQIGARYNLIYSTGTTWNDPSGLTVIATAPDDTKVISSPTIFRQTGVGTAYGMFYTRGTLSQAGGIRTIRYATSPDGATWKFTSIEDVIVNVPATWEGEQAYAGSILKATTSPYSDPVVDASGRWRIFYSGWDETFFEANIGLAYSEPEWVPLQQLVVGTYDDPTKTYDDLTIGYGGFTVEPANAYSVILRDFVDAANQNFAPGDVIAFIDSPTNLAWTEYANEVGEAFFTLSQADLKSLAIADLDDLINRRVHMEVHRNGEQVWGGWLGEIDETTSDVVLYGYSYVSGYYDLLTNWADKWVGSRVDTIITAVFDAAKAQAFSRVHWINRNVIQIPVTTSGGSTNIVLSLYRAPLKRVLSVFREMAAYAMSDTTNHVIFEVTPTGTFNFYKDSKRTRVDSRMAFGQGMVRSFRRIRRMIARRTNIISVGSSPTTVNLVENQTNAALRAQMGLSQEPIYLSFVRDADELQRVTLSRLERATRVDSDLFLTFYKDSIIPFRATGAAFAIGDIVNPEIAHGASSLTAEGKVVTGQQVVYLNKRENVRLLLGDRL